MRAASSIRAAHLAIGREEGGEVDFLEALAVAHRAVDVADEQDHRLRILERDVDADAGVGRAGPAGDEAHARAARSSPVGAGHERRAAFLAAGDGLDRRAVAQRVEHRQEAFAGHGEDPVAALFDQAIDEQAGGGRRHGQRR